jgi:hypothetical protein
MMRDAIADGFEIAIATGTRSKRFFFQPTYIIATTLE